MIVNEEGEGVKRMIVLRAQARYNPARAKREVGDARSYLKLGVSPRAIRDLDFLGSMAYHALAQSREG